MAQTFLLGPDEEFVQCPYEISHQISNLRFLVHLDKCRRNYIKKQGELGKSPDIIHCRFNDAHHYPKVEMTWHEIHCRDQYSVVKHIQYHNSEDTTKQKPSEPSTEREASRTPPDYDNNDAEEEEEEDWDKDTDGYQAGYDPAEKLKNEAILYIPRGLTKSERKKFRLANRDKFAKLTVPKKEEYDDEDDDEYDEKPYDSSGRRVGQSSSSSAVSNSSSVQSVHDPKVRRVDY